MSHPPPLIGTQAASDLAGVDRSTFAKWVKAGKIKPAVRLSGPTGAMMFNRSDVDALVADRASKVTRP